MVTRKSSQNQENQNLHDSSQEKVFLENKKWENNHNTTKELKEVLNTVPELTAEEKLMQSFFDGLGAPESSIFWNGVWSDLWKKLKEAAEYPAQMEKLFFDNLEVYEFFKKHTVWMEHFLELATGDGSGTNWFMKLLLPEQINKLFVHINDISGTNNVLAEEAIKKANPSLFKIDADTWDMNDMGRKLNYLSNRIFAFTWGTAWTMSLEGFSRLLSSTLTKQSDKLFCTFYARPNIVDDEFMQGAINGYNNKISQKFVKDWFANELKKLVNINITWFPTRTIIKDELEKQGLQKPYKIPQNSNTIDDEVKQGKISLWEPSGIKITTDAHESDLQSDVLIDRLVQNAEYLVTYNTQTNAVEVGLKFLEDFRVDFPNGQSFAVHENQFMTMHTSRRFSLQEIKDMCEHGDNRVVDSYSQNEKNGMIMVVIDRQPYFDEQRKKLEEALALTKRKEEETLALAKKKEKEERTNKMTFYALTTFFVLGLYAIRSNSYNETRKALESRRENILTKSFEVSKLNTISYTWDTIFFKNTNEALNFLNEEMVNMLQDARSRYAINENKVSDTDLRRWINSTIESVNLYGKLWSHYGSMVWQREIVDLTMMSKFVQSELIAKWEYGVFPYHKLVSYTDDLITNLQKRWKNNHNDIRSEEELTDSHTYTSLPQDVVVPIIASYRWISPYTAWEYKLFVDNNHNVYSSMYYSNYALKYIDVAPIAQYLYESSPIIKEWVSLYYLITGEFHHTTYTPSIWTGLEYIREITKTYSTQTDLFDKVDLEHEIRLSWVENSFYFVPKKVSDSVRKQILHNALKYCVTQSKLLYGGRFETMEFYDAIYNNEWGKEDKLLLESVAHTKLWQYILTSSWREVTIYMSEWQIFAWYDIAEELDEKQWVLWSKILGQEVVSDINAMYHLCFGKSYVDYMSQISDIAIKDLRIETMKKEAAEERQRVQKRQEIMDNSPTSIASLKKRFE